jgi:hypothetical protein
VSPSRRLICTKCDDRQREQPSHGTSLSRSPYRSLHAGDQAKKSPARY